VLNGTRIKLLPAFSIAKQRKRNTLLLLSYVVFFFASFFFCGIHIQNVDKDSGGDLSACLDLKVYLPI